MKTLILILALAVGAQAAPPNVVMIISDDQHWARLRLHGPPARSRRRTSTGWRRKASPSAAATCRPACAARASPRSSPGAIPHQHRITSNDPAEPAGHAAKRVLRIRGLQARAASEMVEASQDWPHAAATARAGGLVSLQTGKWWLGDYRPAASPHGMTKGGRHGDAGLEIGRKTMQPIYDFIAGRASRNRNRSSSGMRRMMPHDPHTPPERTARQIP